MIGVQGHSTQTGLQSQPPNQPSKVEKETGLYQGKSTHEVNVACKLLGGSNDSIQEDRLADCRLMTKHYLHKDAINVLMDDPDIEVLLKKWLRKIETDCDLKIPFTHFSGICQLAKSYHKIGIKKSNANAAIRATITARIMSTKGKDHHKLNAALWLYLNICTSMAERELSQHIKKIDATMEHTANIEKSMRELFATLVRDIRPSGVPYPGREGVIQEKIMKFNNALRQAREFFERDHSPEIPCSDSPLVLDKGESEHLCRYLSDEKNRMAALVEELLDAILKDFHQKADHMVESAARYQALQEEREKMKYRTCRQQAKQSGHNI